MFTSVLILQGKTLVHGFDEQSFVFWHIRQQGKADFRWQVWHLIFHELCTNFFVIAAKASVVMCRILFKVTLKHYIFCPFFVCLDECMAVCLLNCLSVKCLFQEQFHLQHKQKQRPWDQIKSECLKYNFR